MSSIFRAEVVRVPNALVREVDVIDLRDDRFGHLGDVKVVSRASQPRTDEDLVVAGKRQDDAFVATALRTLPFHDQRPTAARARGSYDSRLGNETVELLVPAPERVDEHESADVSGLDLHLDGRLAVDLDRVVHQAAARRTGDFLDHQEAPAVFVEEEESLGQHLEELRGNRLVGELHAGTSRLRVRPDRSVLSSSYAARGGQNPISATLGP